MLFRILQVIGLVALLGSIHLGLQATPLLGEDWSRSRFLYAFAGVVSALSLVAIGKLGLMLARLEAAQAALAARLDRQG